MYFRRSEVIYPAVALIILVVISILSFRDWQDFNQASRDLAETRSILEMNDRLLSGITDAESSQRGFLLSGEDHYLDTYRATVKDIPNLLRNLDLLTRKYRTQYDRVNALRTLVPEKMGEMQETILLRREEGLEAAVAVVRTDQGKQAMEQIRRLCGEIKTEEYAKLEDRSAAASKHGQKTRIISTVGSALLVLFLVLSSGALARAAVRREHLISDLIASKKQTERVRDLLHTTLSSIADAVVATDLDHNITFINPVAQALSGWSEAEALGKSIDTVCRIVEEESALLSRDGRRIPVDTRSAPIRDKRGNTIGAVLVFRDITQRRAAEDAVQRSNLDLQQFAYAASHDLKTPLRTVANFSQLLAVRYKNRLDQDANEFIDFIVSAAKHMEQLLDALLEYSRSGEIVEKPRVLGADAALEAALSNLRAEIEETGAKVTHDFLPTLTIDELHLRQIFQNLVGNALKYRSERPPEVHVSAQQNDSEWIFSVRDNGIGIEPQHFERIFGVFKRLHGPEYPGTGIGLATCRRIVERHGGRIWVESQPGTGSTFRFTLPVNARQPVSAAKA